MTIYNFYIFDQKGSCLYYKEWSRPLNTLSDDQDEEKRLMFGMLFSIKTLVKNMGSRSVQGGEGLTSLRTNSYTLHHFETASGLRFVLNTDNNLSDLRANLRQIYSGIYVEYVIKNPLYRPSASSKPSITQQFEQALEDYVRKMPGFN